MRGALSNVLWLLSVAAILEYNIGVDGSPLLPYGPSSGDTLLEETVGSSSGLGSTPGSTMSDEHSSPAIELPAKFHYYGTNYSVIYVSLNKINTYSRIGWNKFCMLSFVISYATIDEYLSL